ncbi:RadC family protein [Pectinatus cerevisiiphilus]|uniref:DNA replication and repair protein RadC n=1 Tax=Pectinatus cerevisiiphilus TaxID=86956 RepID=A0A4R3KDV7_9FIRM|nr:DNA repair protein RadC [Pectinatus cerevisiiphilus]TCS81486.1 DNA replication and repair protein RadC [Pectinatus cerevisiiphilus]
MIKNTMVRDLPEQERPREKLIAYGVQALNNAELLAILLRSGTRETSVLHVAESLLSLYKEKGLTSIVNLSTTQLSEIHGIGPAKAATVLAAVELGRRIAQEPFARKASIKSPADAAAYIMPRLRYETKEKFAIVLLNVKNQILSFRIISVGILNASIVHPREVMAEALLNSAAAIILAHNHPSGDPAPSSEDIATTHRLIKAGRIMGIEIADHIIIGGSRYISFKERGLLR